MYSIAISLLEQGICSCKWVLRKCCRIIGIFQHLPLAIVLPFSSAHLMWWHALALAINSFSSIDTVSTIYSKLHWSNVCYALQNGKKKVSTNPWWTADVDLCFLVHFLGEFRTVVIIDFKGPNKYCSFLCSNSALFCPLY